MCVKVTGGVNIHLYGYISLIAPVCPVFVFVISNQSTSRNHVIRVRRSINLFLCCIKHTARCCRYLVTKARQVKVYNIIKQNGGSTKLEKG